MPFPAKHRDGVYLDLLERMGASSRPRLEACTVCGRPVWRSELHAHRACLESALSISNLGYAPPPPVRPDPVVGNVYASLVTDSHESQVSDATGRANEVRAAAEVQRLPKCRVCRRALTCDQSGVHHECKEAS